VSDAPLSEPLRVLGLALDPDPLFASLIEAVRITAVDAGLDVKPVAHPADTAGCDVVILLGRPGRHRQLLGAASSVSSQLVIWTGEPLPAGRQDGPGPSSPGRAPSMLRPFGSVLRRLPLPPSLDRRRVAATTERLLHANLTELVMASEAGAGIVVTSHDRAAILAGHGITASVVPFGYHPAHAGPLTPMGEGARDIPLLLLGTRAGHTRRARIVDGLLRSTGGSTIRVVDSAWGADRDELLRRTQVVVDVHRIAGNFIGLRLLVTAAAGAVLVTEPMHDPRPFVPGIHHVETPVESMLEVAQALASDEGRRAAIVSASQRLLSRDLEMRTSLEQVLGRAAARSLPIPDGALLPSPLMLDDRTERA
jgi:hypothetical protein